MKHFWILHGTKQINFKYDITRLKEKAMMKERKWAHSPCPRWQWKLFKWITSSLLFPSAIFQHRHTPMCLLISKHGDHLFQRVWKRKRKLLRMKEYLPTYLVKIAFSAYKVKVKSLSPVQLCNTMDCSLPGFLCPWASPGRNTGVACHALLQGIFLTQISNVYLISLLHW